jgi:hypothetical protein
VLAALRMAKYCKSETESGDIDGPWTYEFGASRFWLANCCPRPRCRFPGGVFFCQAADCGVSASARSASASARIGSG